MLTGQAVGGLGFVGGDFGGDVQRRNPVTVY